MAWRRSGDKPLPKSMLTDFTDMSVALGGDELTFYINDHKHKYTQVQMYIQL